MHMQQCIQLYLTLQSCAGQAIIAPNVKRLINDADVSLACTWLIGSLITGTGGRRYDTNRSACHAQSPCTAER